MELSGVLLLTSSQKQLIIDLNELETINNKFKLKINISSDSSIEDPTTLYNNIRINGQIYNDASVCEYEYSNGKSHLLTISIEDDFFDIMEQDEYKCDLVFTNIDDDDDEDTTNFLLYVTKNIINQYKIYNKQTQMIASNMESFMLLRTNPKLTGNVKLVVTEDYNLYLDTFKISENSVLNKQEYRHQPISADGNYPYDVYDTFKYLPATEMYGIYPDSYDPHISYHKMDDQIRNIYEYGAELNTDKLYSENMKILAPLYIGKHLPTYFAIWRTNRLMTSDNIATNTEVFKQLIDEGKCIKIFDLRHTTSIGKYLNNYQETIMNYLPGTCALQFIEQDNYPTSVDHRQGQNTWKGIAYDKGILTNRNETTYFATQTLNGDCPQENFDMFILNGYSRNKLLFPNIINLEYMFNDPDSKDFSMHNYFGLYLTENDFLQFNEVFKRDVSDKYNLEYYDENDNLVNIDTTTLGIIEDPSYIDRIFFASTENAAANLTSKNDFIDFVKREVVNKPQDNLIQLGAKLLDFKENEKAFLTFDFTEQIHYGEHFKFIIPEYEYTTKDSNETKQIVFEVIASNDSRLKTTKYNISPYVQTNTVRRVDNLIDNDTEIYTVVFYTQDLEDETKQASLEEQIVRLTHAIKKFDNVLTVSSYGKESLAIISSVKDVYFQHIMSNEFTETADSSNNIDTENIEVYDTLRYYNYNNVQKCEYIEYNNNYYKLDHMSYANNGLEEILYRYANITKFTNIDNFVDEYVYEIGKDIYEETNKIRYPLIYTVNGYFPMVQFENNNGDLTFKKYEDTSSYISEFSLESYNLISIISPFNVEKSIICSPYEADFINEQINICSPLALNVGLMGINSIKDIDVYVNLEKSENHSTPVSVEFKPGEYVNLDNSDSRLRKFVTYTVVSGGIDGIPSGSMNSFTITDNKILYTNYNSSDGIVEYPITNNYIHFVDKSPTVIMLVSTNSLDIYNYTVNYPILNENNYYIDPNNTYKSNLAIPLVPLINCQWTSNGVYFDTQSILNVDSIINNYDLVGNFNEHVYTPGSNKKYIVDSINSIIEVDGQNMTMYDYILHTGSIKKYLCSCNKIDTAIGYYNPYVQTLEFIYYGIKFILNLSSTEYTNEIKLNEFNNYEVYILNDYNGSLTNEIIISKKEEFILIINHVYKSGEYYDNSNAKIYKNNILQDVNYNWYEAPFNYEMKNISCINNRLCVNKSNSKQLIDTDYTKSFVEIDLKKYVSEYKDFDKGTSNYAYFDVTDTYENKEHYDIYDSSSVYITKTVGDSSITNQTTLIGYDNIFKKYQDVYLDFREKHGYIIKQNLTDIEEQEQKTYSTKLSEYINSFNKSEYDIYIIETNKDFDEKVEPIQITADYKPLNIQMVTPNMIKYNNGLFNPNFIDIFNFELNDSISDKIGLDTLYGNTLVKSIDSLKNYYNNKVIVNDYYSQSIGKYSFENYSNNYFVEDYRSPFSTNWDKNIYRSYEENDTYKYLPGYSLGVDDKMFFGSKVLNLHNDGVILSKWNYQLNINKAQYITSVFNERTTPKQTLEIQLNLTKTFYNYVFNNEEFVNNWKSISNFSNVNTYINNYINNVLYNIYNFKGDFDVILYQKYTEKLRNESADKHFIMEENSLNQYEVTQNYKTEFENINNEVILTITISDFENYIYYPTVKINKI